MEYEGARQWLSPGEYEASSSEFFFDQEPAALKLVRALHCAGFGQSAALELLAQLWRPQKFTDETAYHFLREMNAESYQVLQKQALVIPGSDEACDRIVEKWPFPLYELPMKIIKISKEKLRRRQRECSEV